MNNNSNELINSIRFDNQNLPYLQTLIDNGIDVNEGNPLRLACSKHRVGTVRLLLKHGAKITPPCLKYALSSNTKCMTILRLLLEHGADPDLTFCFCQLHVCYFCSPVLHATLCDDTNTLKILLDHGANPNFPMTNSPLWSAVASGYYGCVKLLLAYGASLNVLRRKRIIWRWNPRISARIIFECLQYDQNMFNDLTREETLKIESVPIIVILTDLFKCPLPFDINNSIFEPQFPEVSYSLALPYFQRKRMAFLMGGTDEKNQDTSVFRFFHNRLFDRNVLKIIFSFVVSSYRPSPEFSPYVIRLEFPDETMYLC